MRPTKFTALNLGKISLSWNKLAKNRLVFPLVLLVQITLVNSVSNVSEKSPSKHLFAESQQ